MGGKKKKKSKSRKEEHTEPEHVDSKAAEKETETEEAPEQSPLDKIPRFLQVQFPRMACLETLDQKILDVDLSSEDCKDLTAYFNQTLGGKVEKKLKERIQKLVKKLDKGIRSTFGGKPVQLTDNDGIFNMQGMGPTKEATKLVTPLLKKTAKTYTSNGAYQNIDVMSCLFGMARAMNCSSGDKILKVMGGCSRFTDYLQLWTAKIAERKAEVDASEDEWEDIPLRIGLREGFDVSASEMFRGFVYNDALTGISQLHHNVHFQEHTVEYLEGIVEGTQRLWGSSIHPKLSEKGLHSYIMDYAYRGSKLTVVAVHPFVKSTSPLLFDWTYDMRHLQQGECQIRFRKTPLPKPYMSMDDSWKQWVCKYRGVKPPSDDESEEGLYAYFRWVAMGLVVVMTVISIYMYLTSNNSGSNGRTMRRRRRGGL